MFGILLLFLRTRGFSSAGRASALQAGGHRFEPYSPHQSLLALHTSAV